MNKISKYCIAGCAALAVMAAAGTASAAVTTLSPTGMAASSTLYEAGFSHDVSNVYDYDLSTAWVEGVNGNGIGEFVDLFFPAGTVITGGTIYPGYYKNQDIFEKNSAVSRIQVQSGSQIYEIDTSAGANSYRYDSGVHFTLPEPIFCDGTLRVKILDVRAGWKYTDTCISELRMEYDDALDGFNASGEIPVENGAENAVSPIDGSGYATDTEEPDQVTGDLATFAGWIYRWRNMTLKEPSEETILLSDLSSEDKAFLLYWYQYNIEDSRIEPSETLEYNYLSDGLLRKILIEMFGNATVGDRNAFYERYVESVDENGVCKVGATGDFGDAGYFFFKPDQKARMDGDRLMVTGEIMVYQPEDGNYAPDMSFTAWFTPNDDDAVWGWCFDELRIGGAYA